MQEGLPFFGPFKKVSSSFRVAGQSTLTSLRRVSFSSQFAFRWVQTVNGS